MTPKREARALGKGEAGRPDTRSDLHVAVEAREGGGIQLELRSKVDTYYGDAMREQAARVLEGLGVTNARIQVEDQGALPFTFAARLEAAVRRAGLGEGRWAPLPARERSPSPRERLRRSRLYLPGAEPKFFVNAALHGADAIILDLEDSVHPDEKDTARILVRNALREVDFGTSERMVRINQLPLGLEDLEEVIPERPDLILIPKVEAADQVREVDRAVQESLKDAGLRGEIWIMPILESALGVENAFAIAGASSRVVALTIGLEDLTADMGVVKTAEGSESLFARSRVVNAAKAAKVQAIDSVYGDVEDLDGLRDYGRRSHAMGFEGMGCIHPRQIPIIHEAYAPTPQELEKAVRIVEAFEEAEKRGLGVVSLGSKMIDPPVVKRARKLVREARSMGLHPGTAGREGDDSGEEQ
jgi:citrate lyase subunit beta/citryl-CoA lyase